MSNRQTYRSIINLIIPVGEQLSLKAEKSGLTLREEISYDI